MTFNNGTLLPWVLLNEPGESDGFSTKATCGDIIFSGLLTRTYGEDVY